MKSIDGIEVVVFDIGGVLVDLNYEECVSSFEALGLNEARDMVSCYHPAAFFGELERGEITPSQFFDKVREVAGIYISDEDIVAAHSSILESIPVEKLQLLERLKKRGYRLYTLSNMSAVLIGKVKALMEADSRSSDYYFDHMFLSYEMGMMKPTPEIYDKMIEQIGLSPDKILFIDDGEKNVEAARAKGIQTYLAAAEEDFSHIFE